MPPPGEKKNGKRGAMGISLGSLKSQLAAPQPKTQKKAGESLFFLRRENEAEKNLFVCTILCKENRKSLGAKQAARDHITMQSGLANLPKTATIKNLSLPSSNIRLKQPLCHPEYLSSEPQTALATATRSPGNQDGQPHRQNEMK